MNFYRIYSSSNGKVIGKFPQVCDGIIATDWEDPNYIGSYFLKKAPPDVDLPQGILAKRAKKTDLLSVSFAGFELNLFISKELKNILSAQDCFGMQFFPTELIVQPSQKFEYWLVHPYLFGYEFLDFEKSSFALVEGSISNKVVEQLTFSSSAELVTKQIEVDNTDYSIHKPLSITMIMFLENIACDFFALRGVSGGIGFYVSERLKNEIEKAGCTGMVFIEPNERYP